MSWNRIVVGCIAGLWLATGSLLVADDRVSPSPSDPLPARIRWLPDLDYVRGGHARQKLDLYLPENSHFPHNCGVSMASEGTSLVRPVALLLQ
jgi:hypothetical protein